jgi:hypothetical protein
MDIGPWVSGGAAAAIVGLLTALAVRERLRRRRRRPRAVEAPNSAYTAQLVRDREDRIRWENMALERLHEINRGEVEGLLERVLTYGAAALRPDERVFLDRMAQLAGPSATPRPPDPAPDRPTLDPPPRWA